MIAATDQEKAHQKFWTQIYKAKAGIGGLSPENAAERADAALKQLKLREENAEFEW